MAKAQGRRQWLGVVYDELRHVLVAFCIPLSCLSYCLPFLLRRRSWCERANNNDATLNIESEAAAIDKAILMEAEAKYDTIEVCCLYLWSVFSYMLHDFPSYSGWK